MPAPGGRARLRELGIAIGRIPTGEWNAITDVPGVKVGQVTIVRGEGALQPGKGPVRTGVTAIIPRDDVWNKKCFAASFVLNGNGEMTATNWVQEAGWLETPILLTDTLNVGKVSDGVVSWMSKLNPQMGIADDVVLPLVAECDDSFLNDQRGRHVSEQDVLTAIEHAKSGPVAEGAVGAGTGMVSYRFKGGIGTSSRKLPAEMGGYTIGVLVNCNMGTRDELRIDGVPVGAEIQDLMPKSKVSEGSIIIVVATDAPLLPHQLQRLAKRSAMGLARTGTIASHGSGDFIIAFSTANTVPHYPNERTMTATAMNNTHLNPLFTATNDCTQEAIANALTMATTTEGRDGNTAYALPLDRLQVIMKKYGRL
ncbi:MAG: P1 family peptidase [Candidatus Sericytochromatia bacterium]|nr:P1 family peptidase [Candidatus Sericytochromatia bacterium]